MFPINIYLLSHDDHKIQTAAHKPLFFPTLILTILNPT